MFSSRGGTLRSFTLANHERADHTSPVQLVDTTKRGSLGMIFTSPASHAVDTRQLYFTADTQRDTLRIVDTPQQLTFEARLGLLNGVSSFTSGPAKSGAQGGLVCC